MTGFLLATNVISEAIRPKPDANVAAWIEAAPESLLYLSVLTLGEIRKGIEALPNPSRRVQLEVWLQHDLIARFQERILPIDLDVAQRWGELVGRATLRGTPMPVVDGLMAVTAAHYNRVFGVSGHEREAAGVLFFNPWET